MFIKAQSICIVFSFIEKFWKLFIENDYMQILSNENLAYKRLFDVACMVSDSNCNGVRAVFCWTRVSGHVGMNMSPGSVTDG